MEVLFGSRYYGFMGVRSKVMIELSFGSGLFLVRSGIGSSVIECRVGGRGGVRKGKVW